MNQPSTPRHLLKTELETLLTPPAPSDSQPRQWASDEPDEQLEAQYQWLVLRTLGRARELGVPSIDAVEVICDFMPQLRTAIDAHTAGLTQGETT